MHVVKRTKSPPPGPGPAGPAAVHWAAAVSPAGAVTAWTADRAAAAELGDAQAARVRACYAARPLAGRIELVPARGEPPVKAGPTRGRGRSHEPAEAQE